MAQHNMIIPTEGHLSLLVDITANGGSRNEAAEAMGISPSTLGNWITGTRYPEVQAAWMQAKQIFAMDTADDIMRVASAPLHEDPKLANAEVTRRRLIVDSSKWIAQRLLPKVYGERVDVDISGDVTLSPLAQLRMLTPDGPIVDIEPSS
jgi:transcriptional regulator with XRE-family HTH domain